MRQNNSHPATKPTRILVVDDEGIIRDPITAILRKGGFETFSASNGKEALRMVEANAPDLIVLDVHMPEMDGLTLLKLIRERPPMKDIPVILLTVETDRNVILQASELGVKEYMLKSHFKLNQFLERVDKCLKLNSPAAKTVNPNADARLQAAKR